MISFLKHFFAKIFGPVALIYLCFRDRWQGSIYKLLWSQVELRQNKLSSRLALFLYIILNTFILGARIFHHLHRFRASLQISANRSRRQTVFLINIFSVIMLLFPNYMYNTLITNRIFENIAMCCAKYAGAID